MKKIKDASFKIPLHQQIILFKQISFFLKSGASLEDCFSLSIGATSTGRKALKKKNVKIRFLEAVQSDISVGMPLYRAFATRCRNISPSLIAVCEAGEESGQLQQALDRVCQELLKKDAARKKILSALTYPICIAFLAIVLTAGMTFGIFPKIRPLLESMHTALPFPTRVLIFVSDTVARRWQLLILVTAGITDIFWLISQSKKAVELAKHVFGRSLLIIPVIKDVTKGSLLATFTSTLGTLMAAGLPAPNSLNRARSSNTTYAGAITEISLRVEKGNSLAESFSEYPALFPEIMVQLVTAAEASGSVAETCLFLSGYFQNESDELIKKLSSLAEPALMVLMGCSVGFIALAMILPIYALSQSVSSIH